MPSGCRKETELMYPAIDSRSNRRTTAFLVVDAANLPLFHHFVPAISALMVYGLILSYLLEISCNPIEPCGLPGRGAPKAGAEPSILRPDVFGNCGRASASTT